MQTAVLLYTCKIKDTDLTHRTRIRFDVLHPKTLSEPNPSTYFWTRVLNQRAESRFSHSDHTASLSSSSESLFRRHAVKPILISRHVIHKLLFI